MELACIEAGQVLIEAANAGPTAPKTGVRRYVFRVRSTAKIIDYLVGRSERVEKLL